MSVPAAVLTLRCPQGCALVDVRIKDGQAVASGTRTVRAEGVNGPERQRFPFLAVLDELDPAWLPLGCRHGEFLEAADALADEGRAAGRRPTRQIRRVGHDGAHSGRLL